MDWGIMVVVFLFGVVCCGTICLIYFRRKQKRVIDSLQEMVAARSKRQFEINQL
ncbi:hypothetical protein ABW365_22090 [Enterococcus avium]